MWLQSCDWPKIPNIVRLNETVSVESSVSTGIESGNYLSQHLCGCWIKTVVLFLAEGHLKKKIMSDFLGPEGIFLYELFMTVSGNLMFLGIRSMGQYSFQQQFRIRFTEAIN